VTSGIRNFFEPDWVAPRYAASRPDVASAVAEHLRALLHLEKPLGTALDVGCGTGLSTLPLRAISERVVGVDLSPSMLHEADRGHGALFARGRGEVLPFSAHRFALVTIGCAYHWCETARFLDEILRVLEPSGHLVIYDCYFFGDSPGPNPLFEWLRDEHWPRLPRAARNPLPELGCFDDPRFELVDSRRLEFFVPMTRERLITYLTTQSGAVAAVESGDRSLEDIEVFLRTGLSERVPEEGARFRFGGPIWVVRPVA